MQRICRRSQSVREIRIAGRLSGTLLSLLWLCLCAGCSDNSEPAITEKPPKAASPPAIVPIEVDDAAPQTNLHTSDSPTPAALDDDARQSALPWIPENTEIVVHVQAASLMQTPLLRQLRSSGQTVDMPTPGWMSLDQIDSVTACLQGLDAILAAPQSVNAGDQVLLILRSLEPVDVKRLDQDQRMQRDDESAIPHFRRKDATARDVPEVLAVPEPNVLLVGTSAQVESALKNNVASSADDRDWEIQNRDGQIHLLARPADRGALAATLPQQLPAEVGDAIAHFVEHGKALSLHADLQDGVAATLHVESADSAQARTMRLRLEALADLARRLYSEHRESLAYFDALITPVVENLNVQHAGSTASLGTRLPQQQAEVILQARGLLSSPLLAGDSSSNQPRIASLEQLRTSAVPATVLNGQPEGAKLVAATRWVDQSLRADDPQGPPMLDLVLQLVEGTAADVVALGPIHLESQELANGERLKRAFDPFTDQTALRGWQLLRRDLYFEHPEGGVALVVPCHHPLTPGPIATLAGTFTLKTAGRRIEGEIPNLLAWLADPVDDEELRQHGLSVRVADGGTPGSPRSVVITLESSAVLSSLAIGESDSALERSAFVDSRMFPDGRSQYTISLPDGQLPDRLPARYTLATDLTEHMVGFTFREVPMPASRELTPGQRALVTWKTSLLPTASLPGVNIEARARWSIAVGFDAEGNAAPAPLEIAVDLVGEPASRGVAFGKLTVQEAESDAGPLKLRSGGNPFETEAREKLIAVQREFAIDEYPPDGLQAVFTFERPEKATSVKLFAGELTFVIAGSQREIAVENILEHGGQSFTTPELEALGLRLAVQRRGDNLTIALVNGRPESVDDMQLVDAQGLPLDGVVGGRSSFGGAIEFSFQSAGPLPAQVNLQVKVNEDLSTHTIPFRFEDLPIPAQ